MHALGIDLGGTNARAAVVDASGALLSAARRVLEDRSPEAVVAAIADAASEAISRVPGAQVQSCGMGVPGQLQGDGVVAVAPNLGWRDVPIGPMVSTRLGRAVRVVNDLSAAAWGELKAGAGVGSEDVFVVFVGSGVGSAIITGGRLLRGTTGVAGELGHIKVVLGGRRCGCGELGCLEAYVGGHNLIAQMREVIAEGRSAPLSAAAQQNALTPAALESAAEANDPAAVEIYERAVSALALSIGNQVTVLNPARVVLGGGVLAHCPGIRRRIQEGVLAFAAGVARRSVRVVEAALGDDSGIVGAALLSREP